MGTSEYEATFSGSKLSQKNLKSNYERAIRMCIRDDQGNNSEKSEDESDEKEDKNDRWIVWQWVNDTKKSVTYAPDIAIQLESSYREYKAAASAAVGINSKVKIEIPETKAEYTVDFNKMAQINSKSSFVRDVKRSVVSGLLNFLINSFKFYR
jgi:hypothetical protein